MSRLKVAFIHDGPIFVDDRDTYYEYAYHGLLERYSYFADEITFLIRTKRATDCTRFTPLPDEVNVIPVPNYKNPRDYFRFRASAEDIVRRCVEENDCFVLRLQSSIAEIAYRYIRDLRKPFIIESVGCPWDSYWNHSLLGKLIAPYSYLKTRSIIRSADFVYYVTTDFLQRRLPAKQGAVTVACSNVVLADLDETVLDKRIQKIRSKLWQKKLIFGTAAALDTRYKGQEYMIRAIPSLLKMGFDVEYRLAGGRNRNEADLYLENVAKKYGVCDRVKFCGSLTMSEMNKFYDDIDIYVQPSKQEGLPRAVIEALSRGCPAIGSDIAGIPELIQPSYLFKKGNEKEIVAAVERLVNSDLEEVARENFSKAAMYQRRILEERRKRFYDAFMERYWPKINLKACGGEDEPRFPVCESPMPN